MHFWIISYRSSHHWPMSLFAGALWSLSLTAVFRMIVLQLGASLIYPGEVKCTRISSQISALIVRMSIQGSSGGTSIPRATAAAGVQKPCHPLRTSTCAGRAVRCPPTPVHRARGSDLMRTDISSHFTVWITSTREDGRENERRSATKVQI